MKTPFSLFFLIPMFLNLSSCSSSGFSNPDKCHWLSLKDASKILGHAMVVSKTAVSDMQGIPCSYDDGSTQHILTFRAVPEQNKLRFETVKSSFPKAKMVKIGEAGFASIDKHASFTTLMLYIYQKGSIIAITARTPNSENDEAALLEKGKKLAEKILDVL